MGRHNSTDRRGRQPLDPTTSADPRVRAVIAELRALPSPAGPRPEFRDELRLQLVAVAPRLISEGVDAAAATGPATRAPARSFLSRLGGRQQPVRSINTTRPLHKPVAVISGAFTVLVALLAGAVWLSSSARPGDPLYGLKRASENVQLQFTGGDKGHELLVQAGERAQEVSDLLARPSAMAAGDGPQAAAALSPHTASLVVSTLNSADDDLRQGVATLTAHAVATRSAGDLTLIEGWVPSQLATLNSALGRVPAGSVHDRVQSSIALVQSGDARARALGTRLGCACQATAAHDSLGPIPCTTCPAGPAAPVAPATTGPARRSGSTSTGSTSTGSTPTGSTPTGSTPTGSTATRSTPVPTSSHAAAAPGATASTSTGSPARSIAGTARSVTSRVTGLLPSLTGTGSVPGTGSLPGTASVPAPVTVNSCGVGVNVGPVSLGGCPSS